MRPQDHDPPAPDRLLMLLSDVSIALSASLDPDDVADRIHTQTGRVLPVEGFLLAVANPATGTVQFPIAVEDGKRVVKAERPLGRGLTEHVLRTARPLHLRGDVYEQARAMGLDPQGRPPRAWLGVPLLIDGDPAGVIALRDYANPDAFDERALDVLTIIAAQAGAAMRSARMFAAASDAYRRLAEAQERLLESERERSVTETVGALNHEVNNPLAAIAGNAQLLLRHPEILEPAVREKIETILESARRIQRVTARMSTLIQATTMPYPGERGILDVRNSIARGDAMPLPPPAGEASDAA